MDTVDGHTRLAWLKKEFNLDDAEFKRVLQLHEAYLPECAERCRKIEEQNTKLSDLLSSSSEITAEVQQLIAERARMRAADRRTKLADRVQDS